MTSLKLIPSTQATAHPVATLYFFQIQKKGEIVGMMDSALDTVAIVQLFSGHPLNAVSGRVILYPSSRHR